MDVDDDDDVTTLSLKENLLFIYIIVPLAHLIDFDRFELSTFIKKNTIDHSQHNT